MIKNFVSTSPEKGKKNLRKELKTFFEKISILIDGSSDISDLLGKIAFHLEEQKCILKLIVIWHSQMSCYLERSVKVF